MMFMPFLLHSEEKIKLKSIEVHGETSLDLDVYKDNKIVRDESKVSFAYGIKTELTNFSTSWEELSNKLNNLTVGTYEWN